jgi:hypothetical protein
MSRREHERFQIISTSVIVCGLLAAFLMVL